MKKRQILLAIVFGAMLAITGCGDDETGGGNTGTGGSGTGGANGTGGTAGNGGGTGGTGGGTGSATSSCEAICGASCLFGGISPGGDYDLCLSTCLSEAPEFDDDCGPQMDAYLGCLEANDCSPTAVNCLGQAQAWAECSGNI